MQNVNSPYSWIILIHRKSHTQNDLPYKYAPLTRQQNRLNTGPSNVTFPKEIDIGVSPNYRQYTLLDNEHKILVLSKPHDTPYWALSIVTSRYNQVFKMKTIILVVAICLLLSANSEGIPMESTCVRTCRRDFQRCNIVCIEEKRTIEEEKECQDSAIDYLGGVDSYCVTTECMEACRKENSQCVRGCRNN
ncbi:hypothetical protein LSAT2_008098 [Lamellibrachia satsuma]|nr:hypothetical protein LSAT2_008098 [Lamellibrachia satsuma]